MDTMSFYFRIEDFERIRCSIPKRKEDHKEMSFIDIFNCKLNYEDEKNK